MSGKKILKVALAGALIATGAGALTLATSLGGQILAGAQIASGALSAAGTITGNEKLSKYGAVLGTVAAVGNIAAGNFPGLGSATKDTAGLYSVDGVDLSPTASAGSSAFSVDGVDLGGGDSIGATQGLGSGIEDATGLYTADGNDLGGGLLSTAEGQAPELGAQNLLSRPPVVEARGLEGAAPVTSPTTPGPGGLLSSASDPAPKFLETPSITTAAPQIQTAAPTGPAIGTPTQSSLLQSAADAEARGIDLAKKVELGDKPGVNAALKDAGSGAKDLFDRAIKLLNENKAVTQIAGQTISGVGKGLSAASAQRAKIDQDEQARRRYNESITGQRRL